MSRSRKFFSQTVNLPLDGNGNALSSIETLLKTAGYGFELDESNDITTTLSMDSFLADALTIIPTNDLYFGEDQYVRDAAAASNPGVTPRYYEGNLIQGGEPCSITDWYGHVVDANASWIYSPSGAQDIQLWFQAI